MLMDPSIDASINEGELTAVSPASGSGTRLVRSAASGFALTILTNVFLFTGQILIPRILSREDYAHYTVSISFVALLALVADLGMTPMFTRLFAKAEEDVASGRPDTRGTLFGSALVLRVGMCVVVAGLVLTLGGILYTPAMISNMAILLTTLVISSRLLIVRAVGESALKGQGKYHIVALFALPDAIVFASLLAFAPRDLSLSSVLWIYSLSNLPGFLLLGIWLTRWLKHEKIRIGIQLDVLFRLLHESIPLVLWTAFLSIHSQIDNLLLDKLSTPFEVSGYAASLRVLSAVLPIPLVLTSVMAPELTRLLHRNDTIRSRQLISSATSILLVFSVTIALVLTAASGDLAPFILGSKYAAIAPLMKWMGWMLVPIFIGTLLTEITVAAGRYWLSAIYACCIMVAVIIGDVLFIPTYGAYGATCSKLIAVSIGCTVFIGSLSGSHFFDQRAFVVSFLKALGSALVGYGTVVAMRLATENSFLLSSVGLLAFFLAVHFTKLLSVSDVRAMLLRLRVRPGK